MTNGAGRRVVRLLRGAVYSLVPALVLFGLAEGTFWALGMGSPAAQLSLSRGFDEGVSYIVPDDGPPGSWRTQIQDSELPEIRIPPKGDRVRVLLFGGSNVELFPTAWLQEQLDRAAPDPGFEVINLGRRGYGSERERILLEQALVTEPDVVVIYCGHNEFVEGEFKLELRHIEHTWLADVGSHVRTINVLSDVLRRLQRAAPGNGARPEARMHRGKEFDTIKPAESRRYYDAYRENLGAMCHSALSAGAEVLLSTLVTNVLLQPSVSRERPDMTQQERIKWFKAGEVCRRSLPERLTAGLSPRLEGPPVINLRFEDWQEPLTPDPAGPKEPVPLLRPLSGALARGPFWSDPTVWTELTWRLMRTMEAFHERDLAPEEQQSVNRAVAAGERSVSMDAGSARACFELACALYVQGKDDARAVALFHQAAELDAAPTHANDVINGIVRDTAQAFPDVAFVDAERLFRDASPSRLVSYEVMMDNCHLHLGARKVLLDVFVPEIVKLSER